MFQNRYRILLFLCFLGAFVLRISGIDWDQGFHLHPDERMLVMVADRIQFFSQLNPDFFNYGTLPLYVLKGTAQLLDGVFFTHFANYNGLLYLGRFLSVLADMGVLFLLYRISSLLFTDRKLMLVPVIIYATAVFPIQNSNFFVVDTFLNFFVTLLLYWIVTYRKHTSRVYLYIGITCGAILATKVTGIIFVAVTYCVILILSFRAKSRNLRRMSEPRIRERSFDSPSESEGSLRMTILFISITLLSFFLFMPYAFIEHTRFLNDILLQSKMNSDPYIFPYTLQYVATIPYLYYIKNIFLWGLGPIMSLFAFLGIAAAFIKIWRKKLSPQFAIIFLFYLVYFLIIGRSAVKFMRYMLPLYPLFVILAADGIHQVEHYIANKIFARKFSPRLNQTLLVVPLALSLVWTISFTAIHNRDNTRVIATRWILKNIPPGSTIGVEHWDDRLPLTNSDNYRVVELPLYDLPDDNVKWQSVEQKLNTADYLIIASNRLYVPLQKLADCRKYKVCYPRTAEYYSNLFSERNVIANLSVAKVKQSSLNEIASSSTTPRNDKEEKVFQKVAEFTSYPTLPFINYELRDDAADESFTVYDHPKIMIFKKNGVR